MSDSKRVYHNCLIKNFVIDGGGRTTSFKRALNAFIAGKDVKANIHVMGYGSWKTSVITNFDFKMLGRQKKIETENSVYLCYGREAATKIRLALVVVSDEQKPLSTGNNEDIKKLEKLIESGQKLRAQIFTKDGGFFLTSRIVEVKRGKMTTESGSVYKWKLF